VDAVLDRLASFAGGLRYEDLPADVVHAAKRTLVDSLGCAYGAYDSIPATIARRLTESSVTADGATILGTGVRTTADLAAFTNGVMVRYLDFNDTFESHGGGGHPSDYIPTVLAAAERTDADGRAVITGIVIAYEIFCRMTDVTNFGMKQWDHVTNGAIASASAASALLGLDGEQTRNAISMATVANVALQESRVGNVSMWKGCASANACRNGVFAALLAEQGITAPPTPFAGRAGFFKGVSGEFEAPELGGRSRPFSILSCDFKNYPSGYFSQTAIQAAVEVRAKLPSLAEIETIDVGTFPFGLQIMAGDDEKWHPKTRESADHSLPYTVAAALLFGDLEVRHFDDERLVDPELMGLIRRVKVRPDPESERVWPKTALNTVTVTTTDGMSYSAAVGHHRGHHKNPMTDTELETKFELQVNGRLSGAEITALMETIWNLDHVEHVSELLARTRLSATA
jgi:2-methylcitrate dehydratase